MPQPTQHDPDQTFLINYEQLNTVYLYLKRLPWEDANQSITILQNLPPGQPVPQPKEPTPKEPPLKVAPGPEPKEPEPEAAKE